MKLAYFTQNRPEFLRKIPREIPHVIVAAEADGSYSAETLARLQDVDAFMIAAEPVTEQLLAACPRVRIVQRMGVGYNTLDLKAAARREVYCCNVAGVNKEAVAEFNMTHLLSLHGGLREVRVETVAGNWQAASRPRRSRELNGSTIGILGLGDTGSSLAKRALGFGLKVLYNDVRPIEAKVLEETQAVFAEKDALFAQADFVHVCVDLNPSSMGMVNAARIGMMKPSAYLICCARGGIVDEQALADALNGGNIAGAGIDVFSQEPPPADNPLFSARNIQLTPHIAGVTPESGARNFQRALENVRRVVEQDIRPQWVVNGL